MKDCSNCKDKPKRGAKFEDTPCADCMTGSQYKVDAWLRREPNTVRMTRELSTEDIAPTKDVECS